MSTPGNTALIEVSGNGLDAHGTAIRTDGEPEDDPDYAGLLVVDDENFLLTRSTPLLDFGAIAKRGPRPVPETLSSVLQHGAMDVFRRFAGLMLIEDIEHLADKLAAGVLSDVLGDGNEFDADLAQLTDIEFRMKCVTAEAGERMHHQIVEGMVRLFGFVDHLLENGAILVQS
ncbi:hypothetical protein BFN67_15225 [Pseudaminobacter manganicus]|uniref:Uncharacterized protein n=1 Tax=Manganibacter manganicus TaxID=1873176 RepID=A0A1V8RSZ8_9HYPH|nr:hypothetical protein [Pseudaminobacter manganicus]OQM76244.1 hypothetical protein BFN67_15225 [Pseudaminobacter manganicus]